MKTILFKLCTIAVLFTSFGATCKKPITDETNTGNNFVDPFDYGGQIHTKDSTGKPVIRYIRDATNKETINYLTNEEGFSEEMQLDATGNASYMPAKLSSVNTHYRYIMDYGKFSNENVYDTIDGYTNDLLGFARVGVGLRIGAEFTSTKNNLDISSPLAMSVSANYLHGWIRVDVIGIQDPEVTKLFPIVKEISASSIADVMTAMHDIKQQIYSAQIIRAQVLSIKCMKCSEIAESSTNSADQSGKTKANAAPSPAETQIIHRMIAIVAAKRAEPNAIDIQKVQFANALLQANFMNTDATSAAQFEQQGYDNLKNGKYEDAYKDFIAANNSSFNFNGVYKIAQSLADLKKQTGSWEIPAEKVKTSLTFLLNSNAIDLKYKNLF